MKRIVLTNEVLAPKRLQVFPRVLWPTTVMATNIAQMRAHIKYWYEVDDEEREHCTWYMRMMSRKIKY